MRLLELSPVALLVSVLVLLLTAAPPDAAAPEAAATAAGPTITFNNPTLTYPVGYDWNSSYAYIAGCFCYVKGYWGNAHSYVIGNPVQDANYTTFDPGQVNRFGDYISFDSITCWTDTPE